MSRAQESEQDYLLGTDDDELSRLAYQHQAWARPTQELWERAGFTSGQTLLDLGCGPGFATLELARLVGPRGKVVAADASRRFLDHVERRAAAEGLSQIQVVEGDVHSLPLPEAAVDGAYARWLLCFARRPEALIAEVARCLRPGGRFAVTDYFNYRSMTLAPRSAALDQVLEGVFEYWRQEGGDLDIQGKVPGWMSAAGLKVVDIHSSARVARPGSALWHWPETFFRGFVPRLVEAGLVSAEIGEEFWSDWALRSADPDAFLAVPLMFDIVGVKA